MISSEVKLFSSHWQWCLPSFLESQRIERTFTTFVSHWAKLRKNVRHSDSIIEVNTNEKKHHCVSRHNVHICVYYLFQRMAEPCSINYNNNNNSRKQLRFEKTKQSKLIQRRPQLVIFARYECFAVVVFFLNSFNFGTRNKLF